MKKLYVSGICFLVFAIVFSAKYITAAILLIRNESLSIDIFRGIFDMIPLEVTVVYFSFLIMGILFLILGLKEKNEQ
ncbi:hypothetical protein [Bacillus pumilus]|uniref:Uncharacterized protein n=1 Tax=Bacillus pumilus (strain SAFR-032) TaxID=315750 RepID=A8FH36_BACP2|nr:hypothetical protein [Bacillus pumilus]ABV63553.1 hypothetical protein BPUM_2898 [Bacillus pumilus SAFR-032]MBC3641662.1 hypothetical protein [Bacillus pumilus]MBC3646332.1 hypothetical protein [Bacillus pumilus]MBC3650338.1 hypothetical protein [Bacillus pumilus]MBC3651976.1 hypothetical protein [Bacillus pumilus]